MSCQTFSDVDETDLTGENYFPGWTPSACPDLCSFTSVVAGRQEEPYVTYWWPSARSPGRDDGSVGMYSETDLHAAYSLCNDTFWADRDTSSGAEGRQYSRRLAGAAVTDIRDELLYLCRRNFPHRMRVLCEHITDILGLSLCSARLRGDASETALHAALMHSCQEAAEVVVEFGGVRLVLEPYTAEEYAGITALHIAVVKGMEAVVRLMLDLLPEGRGRREFLQAQAAGPFYRTRFSASGSALTLAAWTQQHQIFDLLLDSGAELDAVDGATGNNIFHSMVEFAVINPPVACAIFSSVLEGESSKRWWARRLQIPRSELTEDSVVVMKNYLLRQANLQGYTPLHLAARLGTCCMFTIIANTESVYRFTQWTYGPATMLLYDVTEIDSALAAPGSLSALELLLRTVPDRKVDIFSGLPIQPLIKEKWAAYRVYYIITSLIHVFFMGLMTAIVFNTLPEDAAADEGAAASQVLVRVDVGVLVGDGAILLYVLTRMVPWLYEQIHKTVHVVRGRLHTGPSVAYTTHISDFLGMNPFDPISIVYYCTTMTWIVMHILGHPDSLLPAGFALLAGWYLCLGYLKPFKNIAIFAVILNRIFTGDVLRFMVIFMVIFVAFSTSLMCFFGIGKPQETSTFLESYWTLIRVMMGMYDLNDAIPEAAYPTVLRIVTFGFIVITMIQLLNMLIAAMNDTFLQTAARRQHLWTKLLAEGVVSFESHLPRRLRPMANLRRRRATPPDGRPGARPLAGAGADDRWLLAVETTTNSRITPPIDTT